MAKTIPVDQLAEEVMKGLTEYAELATEDMKKAVKSAGNSVKKQINATAPKDTGAYAKSWAARKTRETAESLTMVVHSKNRYQIAHLLEHGHAKRGGGRVAARPHIAAAEQAGIKKLEDDIKKALGG